MNGQAAANDGSGKPSIPDEKRPREIFFNKKQEKETMWKCFTKRKLQHPEKANSQKAL